MNAFKVTVNAGQKPFELGSVVFAKGKDGTDGAEGYTPQKGIDYWTDFDRAEIVEDILAVLPSGAVGYTGMFGLVDWTAFGTRWQILIPSSQHQLGTAIVVSVESNDQEGYDKVLLNTRRLPNGDILLRADERFDGLVRLQKI